MANRPGPSGKPAAGPSLVAGAQGGKAAAVAAPTAAPAQALLSAASTSGSQRRQDRQYAIEIPKKLATTATTSSRAAVDRILANKNKKYKVAKRLLKLLKRSFLAVPDYNYELGHPSHLWDNDASKAEFYQLCMELCAEAEPLFKRERMLLLFDDSPAYVLGDIHGNYKDLMLFEKTFWRLGLKLCPANVLCLGDYVDRGPHSVETIAYLFAQKVITPHKIFLIRGNHEVRDVNGDFQVYGKTSFLYQCTELLGTAKGKKVWEVFNNCFDQMPISAILDQKVFCVHGGVPRQLMRARERILQEIDHIPKGYVDIGKNELVNDLLWADPSVSNEEKFIQPSDRFPEGFAPNGLRGGEACVFGAAAVQYFGRVTGCSHIIRAHQPPDLGISLGKNAKVITVFSSSHYCGQFNSAAIVLVSDYKIHVIVTTHNEKLRDSPRNTAGALDAPVPLQSTLEYRTPTTVTYEDDPEEEPLDVRGVVPPLVGRQGGGGGGGVGQTGTGLPPLSPSASLLTNMPSTAAPVPPEAAAPLSPRSQAAAVNEFARRSKLYQAPPDSAAPAPPAAATTTPASTNAYNTSGSATTSSNVAAAAGVKPRTFSRQLGFQRSQSATSGPGGQANPGLYGTLPKNSSTPMDYNGGVSQSVPVSAGYLNGSSSLSSSYGALGPGATSPKKGDNPLAKQLDSLGHSSPLLEAFATLNNALNRQETSAPPQP